MIKVFVDSDVILDLLVGREYADYAAVVFEIGEESAHIQLITSPLVVANVDFIYRQMLGTLPNKKQSSRAAIAALLQHTEVVDISGAEAKALLSMPQVKDYEDALQLAAARNAGAKYLITRNVKDYPHDSGVEILHAVDDALLIRAINAVEGNEGH